VVGAAVVVVVVLDVLVVVLVGEGHGNISLIEALVRTNVFDHIHPVYIDCPIAANDPPTGTP
jgi:hypothetical protein